MSFRHRACLPHIWKPQTSSWRPNISRNLLPARVTGKRWRSWSHDTNEDDLDRQLQAMLANGLTAEGLPPPYGDSPPRLFPGTVRAQAQGHQFPSRPPAAHGTASRSGRLPVSERFLFDWQCATEIGSTWAVRAGILLGCR